MTMKDLIFVVAPNTEVEILDKDEEVIESGRLKVVLENLWYEVSPNAEVDRISSGFSTNGGTALRIRLDCEYANGTEEF